MEIPCTFRQQLYNPMKRSFYTCEILNQDLSESRIINVKGQHEDNKADQDVQCVRFENCTVPKLPQGLTKIFPNLKGIWINNSKLEQITKNELAEYKSLEMFVSISNKVEFLAGNLFGDFDNLEIIVFAYDKLKIIEPNILDELNKLNYVNFRSNVNFNACYSSTGDAEYSKIEELKDELFRKFFPNNSPEIKNFVKRFQSRVQRLKTSNDKLRDKVQNLENLEKESREQKELWIKKHDQLYQENFGLKISTNKLKQELEKINKEQFLLTDIQNFLNNQKYSDLQVQIDDKKFKVHKFLLAARSPTLAEKFLANPEAENLNLTDIDVDNFEKILHFFYTDELPDAEDTNYVQLYGAASILKINLLISFSEPKVLENINPENAVEVLFLSNKFNNNEMRQKAFDEIKKDHPDLSDNWIDKPEKVKKFIEVFGEN